MKTPIPWLRVFIEGVVIVGSILLAFGIDAWWEGRQEREEERDILVRLDAEFGEAGQHLRTWRANQQGVARAGREILRYTGTSDAPEISADSLGNLIWTINFSWSADPPLGFLSSVIATGQLATLRSEDIRGALVRWEAEFLDLRTAERVSAEMNDRRIIPLLEQGLAFRTVVAASVDPELGRSSYPLGLEQLLTRREFESVIANRVVWVEVIVEKYDAVLAGLDRAHGLVREELAQF